MIASPGDVAEERNIAKNTMHKFNEMYSYTHQVVVLPITWETHSRPAVGEHPQTILNEQLLTQSDLLVGIFGSKLGTPTREFLSGTLEEIEKHIENGGQAMIYFSNASIPRDADLDQVKKLQEFQKKIYSDQSNFPALVATFDDAEDFQEKFNTHLFRTIIESGKFFDKDLQISAEEFQQNIEESKITLSEEAEFLIQKGSASGEIMRLRVMEGTIIQAGGEVINHIGNKRDEAKWESALEELIDFNFLRDPKGKGEIYRLTKDGFDYADSLK